MSNQAKDAAANLCKAVELLAAVGAYIGTSDGQSPVDAVNEVLLLAEGYVPQVLDSEPEADLTELQELVYECYDPRSALTAIGEANPSTLADFAALTSLTLLYGNKFIEAVSDEVRQEVRDRVTTATAPLRTFAGQCERASAGTAMSTVACAARFLMLMQM